MYLGLHLTNPKASKTDDTTKATLWKTKQRSMSSGHNIIRGKLKSHVQRENNKD